jgi:hypothetical protein
MGLDSRREGDSRPNPAFALLQRQGGGIVAGAWCTAEGVLLQIAEAPMAELLLLPVSFSKHGIAH